MRLRPLRPQLGQRLDQEDQALERYVGARRGDDPPRHLPYRRVRREQPGVGADRHGVDTVGTYAEILDDLVAGRPRDGEHGRQPPGDALLHPREAVPAAQRQPPLPVLRGGQFEPAVDRDGVVDRGDQRHTEAQQPVSERLVVVHDVEVAAPRGQMAAGPQAEGERFGEAAGPHRGDLQRVDPVAVLPACGRAEGVGLPVEVEAGQLGEGHAVAERVQDGVRLRADHLDAVAERGQFAGEVPYVDALAAAEGVALITEQGDP